MSKSQTTQVSFQYHYESIKKIRLQGDLSKDNLNYFLGQDPKFARFYLLPKIHRRLRDVPGRPVISNCGYYNENILSFLENHLQTITQHFLNKINS